MIGSRAFFLRRGRLFIVLLSRFIPGDFWDLCRIVWELELIVIVLSYC